MATFFRHLALATIFVAGSANAQQFQDLDVLELQVSAALGAGIGEPGGAARPIDRRLKLAPCPAQVAVEAPALGAVTVRCEPLGWRIRVPLVRGADSPAVAAAKAEPIIRKGDQVELTAASHSFSVSMLAVAEQDGAPGDRIRLRSERKGPAVIGRVTEDGRVVLAGFK